MAKKITKTDEPYPDTVRSIGESLGSVLDDLEAKLEGDDERIRQVALDVARRKLGVVRKDLASEINGTEVEVVDTLFEYEATGDPGYGEKLDRIKPDHLKMLVEKGNLDPDPK